MDTEIIQNITGSNKILDHKEKAVRYLKNADHMFTQTYRSIKEPKLLLAVLESLFLSLTNAMTAILCHERQRREISPFHDSFESKFNVFKMEIARKYFIHQDYINLILDIKNAIAMHSKSPVEFSRKGKFVICTSQYETKELTESDMKKTISKAKVFIGIMHSILDDKPDGKWKKP